MTLIPCTRTVKSGIAVAVSLALLLSSAGGPATQAYAQAIHGASLGEAGARARAVIASPASMSGVAAPVTAGSTVLSPSLNSMPSAPARSAQPAAVTAAVPGAPVVAAVGKPVEGAAQVPVSEVKPTAEDPGPRWVKTPFSRVAPAAWVARQLSRWTRADAADLRKAFDGETARAASAASSAAIGLRASGLSKASQRADRIINDNSIPTPQAAREVGKIRQAQATPLWVKVVAPLSLVAAGAAAVSYGALPILALGAGLLVSVLLHEVAHIAVLHKLGDRTAKEAGTYSLNPFHLIDPLKTVILPALSLAISSAILPFPLLIGAGKAVDADFNNLHGPFGGPKSARNAFFVAGAGPLTNLLLAGAFASLALLPVGAVAAGVLLGLAKMNLFLTVFNLLPLPQLDGGKMLASALPERFYAKWVYNPKVEKAYQGMFRRLYEGPTALLSFISDKFGIKTQKVLNRVANGVTFGALAAFYAVAYFQFSVSVPLLFLALPCTYDYWCIREKVRSEAAVNDIMQLYSEWAAVISQIAVDKGMKSEVDLFEAEHAMKNALETLVDELMAKEEFRALSKEDKLAAVMKAYPDKAAEFLKKKVFTHDGDTLGKVKELLADSRNEAYMNRLRKWFEDHDIFERWDNPKYEGKLKDAMKEAGKEKGRSAGQRGFAKVGVLVALAVLGGATALFPELAHVAPAWLSGLGVLGLMGTLSAGEGTLQPRRARVVANAQSSRGAVVVTFFPPLSQEEYA
ncbi:MAG: site-2 protease family protein, partial [Elusimicrobiota bacterium]